MEEPYVINVEWGLLNRYRVLPRVQIVPLGNSLPQLLELLTAINALPSQILQQKALRNRHASVTLDTRV